MNIQSWIILILVLLAVGLSVRRVWKNQKSGKGTCSCCDKASTCQLRHQKVPQTTPQLLSPTTHHPPKNHRFSPKIP
ncbi:MAG: FeoB-associated Cys-rich membrane protein [Porphyromonadaceae bacterium]|nr:MAG: FeoB-associated Cys-rich membrane protein [Porphyromonadaceae bacterium]